MRRTMVLKGSAAIVAVTAVAAVSACSTAGSGTATQTHGPSATSAATSGAEGFSAKPAGKQETCQQVEVSIGDPLPSDKTQSKVGLTMVNTGTTTCVLRGFPGVRLTGEDNLPWDLTRTNDPVVDVALAPGAGAISYLTYLPTTDPSGWEVATLQVTPPNTTATQTLDWKLGKVVLQDAATHPGTYIGPTEALVG